MLFIGRLLSGLALPLASGAGTAWIVELCEDRCTAASLSAGAILAGLGLGALISGLLAEYSTEPLVFPFVALAFARARRRRHRLAPARDGEASGAAGRRSPCARASACRARIIGAFVAPAVTVFASFALLGFYSALAPSLLQRSLQVESHAIGGAVIFELYAAAVLVLALTHWLAARAAMLCGLALLIPSLVALVVAFQSHFAAASSHRGGARRWRGGARLSRQPADRQPDRTRQPPR